MTDHYTETQRLIDNMRDLEGHNADFDMALAQVHATLALAEQQRIANLIALSQATDGNGWQAEEPLSMIFAYEMGDDGHQEVCIRPEIAQALRIETP